MMKKFLKLLAFILAVAAIILGYNYYTNYSLFDFDELYVPSYEEEVTISSESSETDTEFEKLYYTQLNDDEKKVYSKIYYAVSNYMSTIKIHQDIDNDRIFTIVRFVLAENPELFWSNGSCSIDSNGNLTFNYIYTESEVEYYTQQIEANTQEIIAEANACSSDYEKALMIYEYIIASTEYDEEGAADMENNPQDSVIVGALVNGKAVCTGYAKAYQYLLSKCSLNAETVYGTAVVDNEDTEHAWTLQFLDGNYYYTDSTWGDSYESEDSVSYIRHSYFCMTDADISKTHTLDDSAVYPECTATQDNYFVKEGLYFENYKYSSVKSVIKEAVNSGSYFTELKFSSDAAYSKAVDSLINNGSIYYILLEVDPFETEIENDSLSYNVDDDQRVISFFFNEK